MRLYHVSEAEFVAGTVLQPGRWGMSAREYGRNGRPMDSREIAVTLAWEGCLEAARLALAPAIPSRLNCVFTCRELRDAVTFRDQFKKNGFIYEVAKVNEEDPTYVADYNMITNTGTDPIVDLWAQSAVRYWKPTEPEIAEVLVGGPVKIVRKV